MNEKNFVTVYDKDCEEYAETLMSLVSNDSINNIKRTRKEFRKDTKIVSREYVLTIGEKASADYRQNFGDLFNRYGIHIGFNGTRAWISRDNLFMDKKTCDDFFREYDSLREEYGMNTYDHEKTMKKTIGHAVFQFLIPPGPIVGPIVRYKISSNRLKELQYRYAIVLFYRDYLYDFLKIEEDHDKEQNEEQNF